MDAGRRSGWRSGSVAGTAGGRVTATAVHSLAGLLELARAFVELEERPRRSVAFLGVSGGARDQQFWGSRFYLRHMWPRSVCSSHALTIGAPEHMDRSVRWGTTRPILPSPLITIA